ncbi:xylose isomerase-like protein [Tricharina praecox]|uniref:xylose isomerase-like protein n=1 Tax=Tricharina praecox TaxID=43433 RepID=UPI00221FA37D|nr:xylose isomerase-like protein [Tricharina praecox]KAI5851012.1 xylose isomerase-like protein [Tricharina praecox]
MATPSTPHLIPLAYATPSLGMHPSHTLPQKLSAIASAGYTGFELGIDDLVSFARSYLHNPELTSTSWPSLLLAAKKVRLLCAPHSLNLTILMLQPFSQFEGYHGTRRAEVFEKARHWTQLMDALGCAMLQVGSNDDPAASGDTGDIVCDLRELADLVAPRKVAYENWCWGRHVNTWKQAWDVVRETGRENIGLCLDTFQTCGGEWADPGTEDGLRELEEGERLQRWNQSMRQLEMLPKEKIFLLQISDAFRPPKPIEREQWSHSLRPPPGMGGYLPVKDMVNAVLKTGYRGWFSVEVFLEEEHGKEWAEGLEEKWAEDGMRGVRGVLEECGIQGGEVVE